MRSFSRTLLRAGAVAAVMSADVRMMSQRDRDRGRDRRERGRRLGVGWVCTKSLPGFKAGWHSGGQTRLGTPHLSPGSGSPISPDKEAGRCDGACPHPLPASPRISTAALSLANLPQLPIAVHPSFSFLHHALEYGYHARVDVQMRIAGVMCDRYLPLPPGSADDLVPLRW